MVLHMELLVQVSSEDSTEVAKRLAREGKFDISCLFGCLLA